ncbi:hypothetical protein J4G08_00435 [Candidatus Poribacteria bacterium]|nr:hypothetical protein [Candidatus Poribacteria bacterium]
MFIGPDGGVITKKVGYAPPAQFTPVMEEALKKETKFQETLAKLKKMPDDVTLNREIAILYIKREQLEKALLISKKIPDDVKLNNGIALAYLGQKQLEKALPFSKKVIKNDTKNTSGLLPALHIQLGVAYGNQIQGKAEDVAAEKAKIAEMHFQKIIDTYPKTDENEQAQLYLGVIYSISKQYDKSIEVLEKLANHTTDERMKLNAEANLKRVKELAAEAENKTDN